MARAFITPAFLAGAFLAPAFLARAFFAPAFLAGAFFAPALLALDSASPPPTAPYPLFPRMRDVVIGPLIPGDSFLIREDRAVSPSSQGVQSPLPLANRCADGRRSSCRWICNAMHGVVTCPANAASSAGLFCFGLLGRCSCRAVPDGDDVSFPGADPVLGPICPNQGHV